MITASKFKPGDAVFMEAYTDCFKKFHPRTERLTVQSIQYIDNEHAPHWRLKAVYDDGWRLKAVYDDGWRYHEGNQRFFILCEEELTP